ncbi:MAG: TetR/AcrR family transcriptional regulator [Bacteroidetes bacterium]|nr:TetR/AcrR family transcriptional regulator [Bacteroidota bacterium]
MSTKEKILQLTDHLIREKGFNAFSFYDISKSIGIKTASIHYHFPTKIDLGIELLKYHTEKTKELREKVKDQSPEKKFNAFLSIYSKIKADHKVCIVGSLATDLHSIDPKMGNEVKVLATEILEWVTEILKEGKAKKVFHFDIPPRTKALMIIGNMLAALQLSRLTNDKDFDLIKKTILNDLKK